MEWSDIEKQAWQYWQNGQPLEAGRLIYEALPQSTRPRWGATILELCFRPTTRVQEFENLLTIARSPHRWREARAAFEAIRERTLFAEKDSRSDAEYVATLLLAENVAKITYNATDGVAPCDHDAGWWIVRIAYEIVRLRRDTASFEEELWRRITDYDRPS